MSNNFTKRGLQIYIKFVTLTFQNYIYSFQSKHQKEGLNKNHAQQQVQREFLLISQASHSEG